MTIQVACDGIAIGWVLARGCAVGPSPEGLANELKAAITACANAAESPGSVARKAAARNMLRFGTYKPTGRGKPASEYLLNAAIEGDFPFINNLADINNLVSLEALLPISVVDLARTGTHDFRMRHGAAGESYVFNPSGQVLELRDLLLAARADSDRPCASPIKDSQETKTDADTRDALFLVWAPSSLADAARRVSERMAALVKQWGLASEVESGVVAATS